MSSGPRLVITGAPNPWPEGSPPPMRLNIVDFVKNEKMFSLYVQALRMFAAYSFILQLIEPFASVDRGDVPDRGRRRSFLLPGRRCPWAAVRVLEQ